CAQYFDVW
nr:immunoglobulin heavy chain junction region [Mus musculus]